MADSASFNGVAGVDARSLQRVALQISVVMAPPLHFTPKLPFELGQRREGARRCYPRFGEAGRSSTQSRSCGTRIDTTSVLQVFPVEILLVDSVDRIPDPGAHADLGAGNGLVGQELQKFGVARLVGVDISAQAAIAVLRDRPGVYDDYHEMDMLKMSAAQRDHLAGWCFLQPRGAPTHPGQRHESGDHGEG